MKSLIKIVIACLLVCACCFAQTQNPPTNSPQFTLNFNVLNGPLGGAGVDFGATYAVTANYWLRATNLIFPSANGEYFGVGVQRTIPGVCTWLANTNLNCEKFQPYFAGSGGVTRITVGSNPAVEHGAGIFSVGSNYDPTGTGKFTVGLFELSAAHLSGIQSGVTWMISSGLQLGWGTNQAAVAQNEAKREKRLEKERKKLQKLQKSAT
jgi:hypothetical protein